MIETNRSATYCEEISTKILGRIKNNQWMPGDNLPGEIGLSKEFGISRHTLREALKGLSLIGILTTKAGKGTYVSKDALVIINNMKSLSTVKKEISLIEIAEARLIVEPELIYIAINKATKQDILELEEIIGQEIMAIRDKKYTFDLGYNFHHKVIEIANNNVIGDFLDTMANHIMAQREKVTFAHLDEKIVIHGHNVHIQLLTYFKTKQAKKAKDVMYEHLYKSLMILVDKELEL